MKLTELLLLGIVMLELESVLPLVSRNEPVLDDELSATEVPPEGAVAALPNESSSCTVKGVEGVPAATVVGDEEVNASLAAARP